MSRLADMSDQELTDVGMRALAAATDKALPQWRRERAHTQWTDCKLLLNARAELAAERRRERQLRAAVGYGL